MKKLLILATVVSSLMFCALNSAYPASDAKSGAAAKAALKEKFKKNVEAASNGDVYLKEFPEADFSKLKDNENISGALLVFLTYVDPDIDFEALNKSIAKETGGKSGKVPIKFVMAGISKYLGRNNMQLQKVSVSGSNVIQKIDDGVPLIAWILADPIYEKVFFERTKKREETNNAEAWKKDLRKSEVKRLPKGNVYTRALITGYNKKTDEYRVMGVAKSPVWLTEKELRGLLLEAYQLRF